MPESIQEFVNSSGQSLRVDRQSGVLRGVKLLGIASRNGRRYQERALQTAVPLYEGSKVNVNHPSGSPLAPRDYRDRLGVIRGVAYRPGEGLFGDLHFNPRHALSEQLVWDAEHEPGNVGLSHNVLARTARDGEVTVVEEITLVQSVDLVADPAATCGLFEVAGAQPLTGVQRKDAAGGHPSRGPHDSAPVDVSCEETSPWNGLTLAQLETHRPELVTACCEQLRCELEATRCELDQMRAEHAAARRRERIAQLLAEHELPVPVSEGGETAAIVSDRFLSELMAAADDAALVRLVEQRAALVRSAQRWADQTPTRTSGPTSRDQSTVWQQDDLGGSPRGSDEDVQQFAAALQR